MSELSLSKILTPIDATQPSMLFKTSKLFKFANRQISQQKLSIDFKKPFDLLAKLPDEARGEAPSEAANSIWWCLLDEVRTFFEQNPDAD